MHTNYFSFDRCEGNSPCIRLLYWEGDEVLRLQNWEPGDCSGTRKLPCFEGSTQPTSCRTAPRSAVHGDHVCLIHGAPEHLWDGWTHEKRVTEKVANGQWWKTSSGKFSLFLSIFSGKRGRGIEIFWSDIWRWRSARNPIRRCHPILKECPRRFLL